MKLCMNMKYTARTSSADKRSEMCGKWQASYQQYYLASTNLVTVVSMAAVAASLRDNFITLHPRVTRSPCARITVVALQDCN